MNKGALFVIGCIAVLFVACPDKPDTTDVVTIDFRNAVVQPGSEFRIADDFTGFCHSGYSGNLDREYEMLRELGVSWIHRDFSWNSIQPDNENQWNFDGSIGNRTNFDSYVKRANDEGVQIIGMLLYSVDWVHEKFGWTPERRIREEQIPYFVEYAVETVKRYNGKPGSEGFVDAWFIWNEPDLQPRFWTGTHEEFFALNKAVAEAIRKLDAAEGTHTTLVSGVFTAMVTVNVDWVHGLFEHGGMDLVDGIAFHPYSYGAAGTRIFTELFRQLVTPYGFADKMWLNEVGYPSYPEKGPIPPGRNSLIDQYEGNMPEVVTQTITVMAATGAKNFAWYNLFDSRPERDIANPSHWHGLIWQKSPDEWVRKGGYWGYALCAQHIPGKMYKKLDFPGKSIPSHIQSHYFAGDDGSRTLVLWNTHPLITQDVRISLGGSNHRIWDLATGESAPLSQTSTHKLHPPNTYQQTTIFVTWSE